MKAFILFVGLLATVAEQPVTGRDVDKDCRRLTNHWVRSQKSCEQLAQENTIQNLEMVTGGICQTARPRGICETLPYPLAAQVCEQVGMRMCRINEVAKLQDCRSTRRRTWYEEQCAADRHWTALSRPDFNQLRRVRCNGDTNEAAVLCCADSQDTYTTGSECADCPANSYRDESKGFLVGKTTCTCKPGYQPIFNAPGAAGGLQRCEKEATFRAGTCPVKTFPSRTTQSCDGEKGLVKTRGYNAHDGFCIASHGALDGETCPPRTMNTWFDANTYCTLAGARLCTVDEIDSGGWRKLNRPGCRAVRNGRNIITSTKCSDDGNMYLMWKKLRGGRGRKICVSKEYARRATIACCADPGPTNEVNCINCPEYSASTQVQSENECSCDVGRGGRANTCLEPPPEPPTCPAGQYLFTPSLESVTARQARMRGFRDVFGFTPRPGGECQNGKTFSEALSICEAANARLCTEKEILATTTRRSGCGFDMLYIWSGTPCCTSDGTCSQEKYKVVAGKGRGRFYDELSTCVGANERFNVRCCRDTSKEPECKDCPAHSTSNDGAVGVTDCSCSPGYWGANGGECFKKESA